MLKTVLTGLGVLLSAAGYAQVSVTQTATPYTQNFNTLVDTGLNNAYSTLPAGWFAEEFGSGANTLYRAAWGQLSGGDLYSFGDSAVSERALGSVGSGTVAPVYFGVALVNNTGSTVQQVKVTYRGELWRVGNPARPTGPDTLHFAYGKNNGNLHSATWSSFPALAFVSPAPAAGPSNIELNGNAAAQVVNINDTLKNLNLANGDTLWLRWRDENSNSFDDGLGINDVSIRLLPGNTTPAATMLAFNGFNQFYYQSFDSLRYAYPANHAFSTLPFGWLAKEVGSNGDMTYKAAYGEFAGGNLYSFGDSLSADRALGSVGSGTNNIIHYGAAWINKTGQVVNNVEIRYMGEMWRQGRPARASGPDTLHFSYATHASAIDAGNYLPANNLSFYAPVTNGVLSSPMNGNLPANRTWINNTLNGLNLQPNDTLWIRWTDFDSESFDDGLGIDSFSIAAVTVSNLLNMEFKQRNTTVREADGVVKIPLVIHNKSNVLSQVEVFIADTGNVQVAGDMSIAAAYVSFPGTMPDTMAYFQFGLNKNEPFEGDEYFVLGLRNPVNGVRGAIQYDTIHIINYAYPQVPLAALQSENAQGVADSLGRAVEVTGVVHGVNYSASGGLDFYVLQNGAGINVYQPTAQPGSRYVPTTGDQVKIWGSVGQFRGLTRLESIDSIQRVSTGNTLSAPKAVTQVTESEESAYLKLDSMKLYPAISKWPNNLPVYAVNGATHDTVAIYISANTDLAGQSAPQGYFTITGIGSQFGSSTNGPFNNGYRLMAISDNLMIPTQVIQVTGNEKTFRVYPNPFGHQLTIQSEEAIHEVTVLSIDGQVIWQYQGQAAQVNINTASWTPGMYVVYTTTASAKRVSRMIKL
jgi:hypothetical protein